MIPLFHSSWFRELKRKQAFEQWSNPEYASRQRKARCRKPNYGELKLGGMLEKNFPGVWQYVGDFAYMIGSKNPDFKDKGNKVIELCGRHYHTDAEMAERVAYFREFGVDCLVIWYPDLISRPDWVIKNVGEFMQNRVTEVLAVTREHYTGLVYNFSVAEDESYSSNSLVLHNCKRGVNPDAKFVLIKGKDNPAIEDAQVEDLIRKLCRYILRKANEI